jgi:type II secretory pathway pseudopilin PulG
VRRRLACGFTLFELLAIVAILTLLALTLLPALARTSPNSRSFQCLNNLRQLCAAWRMYADDNRDLIVYASDDGKTTENPLDQYAWTLTHMDFNPANRPNWDPTVDLPQRPLWPYTGKNAALYKCPSDQSVVVVNGVPMPRVRSMSMNFYLGGFAGTTGGLPLGPYRIFLKTTELTSPGPAKTFVFLDERPDAINWGDFLTEMAGYSPSNPGQYELADYPGMLHDSSGGFSFADGRAELHRWTDARTMPPSLPSEVSGYGYTPCPRNPDVAWLQDHATRPK